MLVRKNICIIILLTLYTFLLITSLQAANFWKGEYRHFQKGKILNGDNYFAMKQLQLDADVHGDVIAAGEYLTINGNVQQDFIAAGRYITVNGNIGDDFRGAGQIIEIWGNVEGDIICAGKEIIIAENAVVNGSLISAGGDIVVYGTIHRDIKAAAGKIRIDGIVHGNAEFNAGEEIIFGPDGRIDGDLTYKFHEELDFNKPNVHGAVDYRARVKRTFDKFSGVFSVLWEFITITAIVLIGLLMIWLGRNHIRQVRCQLRTQKAKSGVLGFLLLFGIPIGCLIGSIFIFTIPLMIIVCLLYLIVLYLSKIYVSLWIGEAVSQLISDKYTSPYWFFLLGLVVLTLLHTVPVVGSLMTFLVLVFGLGAFTLSITGRTIVEA